MSTLRQAEAVIAIYKNKGKEYDFDEIFAWDGKGEFSPKASSIIRDNYQTYDEVRDADRKGQEMDKQEQKTEMTIAQPEMTAMAVQPQKVIDHAQTAAKALTGVLESKPKAVVINGERYLEFEDWQTLGRFYGISAGAVSTEEIRRDGKLAGFSAKAEALQNGIKVSSAEASCIREERNWTNKPEFQLKSMAQTRACAKALRNVLGWVAVLAGYKPTPAEEMRGVANNATKTKPMLATPAQRRRIFTIAKEAGMDNGAIKDWVKEVCGIDSFAKLTLQNAKTVIDELQKRLDKLNAEAIAPEEIEITKPK